MYEYAVGHDGVKEIDRIENPFTLLPDLAPVNDRYKAYRRDTEVSFIGKIWGFSRTGMNHFNILLCVIIPFVVFTIAFKFYGLASLAFAAVWAAGGLYALHANKRISTASLTL